MNKKKEIKQIQELLKSGEIAKGSFIEFAIKSYLDALIKEQEQMHQK